MSEYLTKEEIKQWRSSLEKITLEEFAARLGKQIEETKQTNDLVDIVLKRKPYMTTSEMPVARAEKISSISEKSIEKERQIMNHVQEKPKAEKTAALKPKKESVNKTAIKESKNETKKIIEEIAIATEQNNDIQIVFKKALTDREQLVFDYFLKNKNKIVYAKDLAALLNLPRDYVYKYIKNLRAKIDGENLKNADSGGFLLSI